jgi:hypothetical protein
MLLYGVKTRRETTVRLRLRVFHAAKLVLQLFLKAFDEYESIPNT